MPRERGGERERETAKKQDPMFCKMLYPTCVCVYIYIYTHMYDSQELRATFTEARKLWIELGVPEAPKDHLWAHLVAQHRP